MNPLESGMKFYEDGPMSQVKLVKWARQFKLSYD